jgi:hypothetical protein
VRVHLLCTRMQLQVDAQQQRQMVAAKCLVAGHLFGARHTYCCSAIAWLQEASRQRSARAQRAFLRRNGFQLKLYKVHKPPHKKYKRKKVGAAIATSDTAAGDAADDVAAEH